MIDSHCHLAGEEFAPDLRAVVSRARAASVDEALCILAAEDAQEIERFADVREAWPTIRVATGIHPHHAKAFTGQAERAVQLVKQTAEICGACAIGEVGLDYHYDFSPPDVQQEIFRRQVCLAVELDLPIIIHTREATSDTFRIIEEEGGSSVRGVFHCFTGDSAMARRALELGFYVSYAGILTFPKAAELREAARITPIDRLLSETDAPYLAPVPHRGKRNEPAFVVRVVEALAELHGVDRAAMEAAINANFRRLFGLAR